jgi:hypothetical protein
MEGKVEIVKPETVNITLHLTAPLKEWRELFAQLKSDWPSWDLANSIREAIGMLEGQVGLKPPGEQPK